MKAASVTGLLVLFAALPVASEAMSGNEVRKLSHAGRAFYVGAVVDTWIMLRDLHQSVPTLSQPSAVDRALIDLANCANERRMTYEQALAVVEKYMADNPGEWGYEMPVIVWRAFNHMCGVR
jgi:hypothetical protein